MTRGWKCYWFEGGEGWWGCGCMRTDRAVCILGWRGGFLADFDRSAESVACESCCD